MSTRHFCSRQRIETGAVAIAPTDLVGVASDTTALAEPVNLLLFPSPLRPGAEMARRVRKLVEIANAH